MPPDPFFIHTAVLPTLNLTLDEALVADVPLCSNALDFVHADANHVNNIVQEISTLTQNDEIHQASFASDHMVYRRLIVYIFAHMMLCTKHERLFKQFKETLQQWKKWDDIDIILSHQVIKDYLWDLLRRGVKVQTHPTLHCEDAFRKLAALDAVGLSSYLTVMVTDNSKYKKVVALRGPEAQSLLNLLHARLDLHIDPRDRPHFVKALLKLSRASGFYPECLTLKGIEMETYPVAGGGYGEVYKGVLHQTPIAVKVLKVYQDSDLVQLFKDFSSEVVLWRQLSHPNILPFYGVYRSDNAPLNLCLTAPWMDNGNAVDFLKRYPETHCVNLALDIAMGLEHLHGLNPSIVHGDLKGANVLITRSERACLADFGLSTAIDSKSISMTYQSSVKTSGTVRWQAPELHDPDVYQPKSKSSDIYAFACVCYELFLGQVPFYEQKADTAVLLGILKGMRPARPSCDLSQRRGLEDEVWTIVVSCWAQDPTERPAAAQVVERLQALPNRGVDERPLDNFSTNLPPQFLFSHTDHPFSALAVSSRPPQSLLSAPVPVVRTGPGIHSPPQNEHPLNNRNRESNTRDPDAEHSGKVHEVPDGEANAKGDDEQIVSPAPQTRERITGKKSATREQQRFDDGTHDDDRITPWVSNHARSSEEVAATSPGHLVVSSGSYTTVRPQRDRTVVSSGKDATIRPPENRVVPVKGPTGTGKSTASRGSDTMPHGSQTVETKGRRVDVDPVITPHTLETKGRRVDVDRGVTPLPNSKTSKFWSTETVNRFTPRRVLKSDRNSSLLSPSKARASESKPVDLDDLKTDDTIIALMGPTGTGKSSFINILIDNDTIVGHDLESCTAEVSMVRIDDVVLVDTPGFDDTNKTDREILSMIADWLTDTYQREIKLAGILYFHRITDNRIAGTPLQNLRMFEKLCGKHALGNVVLTTTMWDKIDNEIGQEREKELRGQYWKAMIRLGSTTVRYYNTRDSAWEILDKVLQSGHNRHAVLLQKEMVDMERQLSETNAGRTLYTALESLVKRRQDALDEVRAAFGEQKDEEILKQMWGECNGLQRQLDITIADLQMMHISVGKRFLRHFTAPQRFFYFP